jgi:hypothetical protein
VATALARLQAAPPAGAAAALADALALLDGGGGGGAVMAARAAQADLPDLGPLGNLLLTRWEEDVARGRPYRAASPA